VNTAPRGRGEAPAPGSAPDSSSTGFGPSDLREIYQDVSNEMAQVPVQGLTRGQRFGMLVSPEARQLGMAKLAHERATRAAMAKSMIDDRIAAKKAEMAGDLSKQQENELIGKFIDGSPEEREGLLRANPFLNSYKDIPQSRENSLKMAAQQAGHIKDIASSAMEIYKLLYHKDKLENEADQQHYDTLMKGMTLAKGAETYGDDVASSHANATKAQSDARVATGTEQDKIDQSHMATQTAQWNLANQPAQFFSNNIEAVNKYNAAMQSIVDGQTKAAEAPTKMAKTLSEISSMLEMSGDKVNADKVKTAALTALNLGEAPAEPPPGVHQNAKGQWVDAKNKPTDYKPPALGVTGLSNAALAGNLAAQGGMQTPQAPLLIQGGVSDQHVQQFKPGQNQLQFIPPPPPTMPSMMNGLPMASNQQPGIGGGMAGHQAPGGGFAAPPDPYQVPPGMMQQYPQYGGAVPASMGAPQQPLQGGVQQTNPVQAFNRAMQPQPQQPAAPQAPPAPQQPGPFEALGRMMQNGSQLQTGVRPPVNNNPQGLHRFALGASALGQAYGQAVGGGIGGAINKAVAPYRMPPPEVVRAQYEAQAVKNADKMQDLVLTPWITPESRGQKRGTVLTDPELVSYFAHKGRDSFTMAELIRRAGWSPPPPNFERVPQPMTHDYERFKRFNTGGWLPPQPQPGDEKPYQQFNPALLPQNLKR
jgi:hypothetical protein